MKIALVLAQFGSYPIPASITSPISRPVPLPQASQSVRASSAPALPPPLTAPATAFTVGAFQNDTFLKLQQHMGPLVLAFSTLALAADLLVAGAMCMLLRRGRSGLARYVGRASAYIFEGSG